MKKQMVIAVLSCTFFGFPVSFAGTVGAYKVPEEAIVKYQPGTSEKVKVTLVLKSQVFSEIQNSKIGERVQVGDAVYKVESRESEKLSVISETTLENDLLVIDQLDLIPE